MFFLVVLTFIGVAVGSGGALVMGSNRTRLLAMLPLATWFCACLAPDIFVALGGSPYDISGLSILLLLVETAACALAIYLFQHARLEKAKRFAGIED